MTETLPADRYPTTPQRNLRGSRIMAVVLTIGVILLGIALAYFAYNKFENKDISTSVISYDIVNDSTMNIRFTVTRDEPSEPAVCIVRARSKDGSETGRREVYVAPSDSGTVDLTTLIRTSQTPAIADIYGCGADVPEYLTGS
ncbi:DUF4307 domain-containing protein [Rhodococcus spelaei]|uniref:DUF4307 domain-containing protein n=1 Tax=Rhodococcus spelaei TaxID=2546320 RepID=A0A541BNL1_9NOCA|nr:DUF4307 domain-containing protein [Rhodococcus spelaei]TQF73917.1 DUF4307 domain-containing protein [Rhodococcus spelaei]